MRTGPTVTAMLAALMLAGPSASRTAGQTSGQIRNPASFSEIADRSARSRTMFDEIAKVLTGPRCLNCHPAGDHPLQGNDHHVHLPPAARGPDDVGVPGLPCASCHTERNFTLPTGEASYRSIPGHPRWGLAPIAMAWEGKTTGDICRQLKDPSRNGGRNLALLHDHISTDDLVGWAWQPGVGRQPAPGTQKQLGELVQAWIDSGAECP